MNLRLNSASIKGGNPGRFRWISQALILVGIGLVSCSQSEGDKNTPQARGTINLAELPALVAPTPIVMPVTIDDPRFPIAPATGDDFSNGKVLYEAHCAECHGKDGEGQQPDPYAYGAAPPHDDNGHTWHHPDQVNFEAVWMGRDLAGKMPGFASKMSVEAVIQVLAYIKTWWSDEHLATQVERTNIYTTNN